MGNLWVKSVINENSRTNTRDNPMSGILLGCLVEARAIENCQSPQGHHLFCSETESPFITCQVESLAITKTVSVDSTLLFKHGLFLWLAFTSAISKCCNLEICRSKGCWKEPTKWHGALKEHFVLFNYEPHSLGT